MSLAYPSKCKECFIVKHSKCHFHKKTKMLSDFQICISLPLMKLTSSKIIYYQLNLYETFLLCLRPAQQSYGVIPSIVIETCLFVLSSELFDCKFGIISFHKYRKQSTKYQDLGIMSLMKL